MMAADVTLGKAVQASVPRTLFRTSLLRTADQHTYAVTRDGKQFLILVPDQSQGPMPITVALNWLALVKK
jgi:hypothetical protein